jgi:hypothetical protein
MIAPRKLQSFAAAVQGGFAGVVVDPVDVVLERPGGAQCRDDEEDGQDANRIRVSEAKGEGAIWRMRALRQVDDDV